MTNELDPLIDQWYRHRDKGQQFYVTATDMENDAIEVQHFGGDLEEFTFGEWMDLDIELSEEPENWSGAIDIGDPDDYGTGITDTGKPDWDEPLVEIRSREGDEDETGENDDYGEDRMEEETIGDVADVQTPGMEAAVLTEQADGVFSELLYDSWIAEYTENAETGLWQADVFKGDVGEWKTAGFESLEEACQAVRDLYSRY